eukprot:EG_transcript_13465
MKKADTQSSGSISQNGGEVALHLQAQYQIAARGYKFLLGVGKDVFYVKIQKVKRLYKNQNRASLTLAQKSGTLATNPKTTPPFWNCPWDERRLQKSCTPYFVSLGSFAGFSDVKEEVRLSQEKDNKNSAPGDLKMRAQFAQRARLFSLHTTSHTFYTVDRNSYLFAICAGIW